MTLAQGCAIPQRRLPTTEELLDTPLPQLLAELDAELELLPIDNESICGVTEVRNGRIKLELSSLWPAPLRELMARSMLGEALRVPMPDLPEPFALTVL